MRPANEEYPLAPPFAELPANFPPGVGIAKAHAWIITRPIQVVCGRGWSINFRVCNAHCLYPITWIVSSAVMGKKWIQWLSWGGGRSGRETVKHSSEVNRKVSTSSAQPLFELDLKPTLSRDEGPSQPGVISNSEATTTNSQATTTDSQASRKESINSINSMHPLLVEYENEHTRRVSLQEPQNLPSIPDSEVENASIPQAEYEDGKRYKDEPEIVTNKEFSSGSEARKWMYKNVIGVGLSFLLVFSAFLGLQNLQSSINAAGGLGLASLGILYLFFTISGFVTPGILKLLGTKYSLLGGFLCHLVYTAANYYPSWYTLVPASALLGFASGPIWAAANTHLVKVAVASAPWLEMDQNHLIGYIVGIFFGFFQGAQIPGNLASSLIFYPYSNNETGLDYYNTDNGVDNASTQHCRVNEDQVLDRIFLYILSSVYLVMVTVGILALVALVDRFPIAKEKNRSVAHTLKMYFGSPFIDLLKMMKNYKMILLVPIATVNGLVQAFIFGTFTQVRQTLRFSYSKSTNYVVSCLITYFLVCPL